MGDPAATLIAPNHAPCHLNDLFGLSMTEETGIAHANGGAAVCSAELAVTSTAEVPECGELRRRAPTRGEEQQAQEEQRNSRGSWLAKAGRPIQLLQIHEVPDYLRFNRYVISGYRPVLDAVGSLYSLSYVHNETVNIFSHGIPMMYILWYWTRLLPMDRITVPILPHLHLASMLSPWVGSTIYHVFMNHESGLPTYVELLKVDLLGIWVVQSFGGAVMLTAAFYCLSPLLRLFLYAVYIVACILSLRFVIGSLKGNVWHRRLCFTFQVVFRAVTYVFRLTRYGGGQPNNFIHLIMQDLLPIIGGFIGATRYPEKWYPGKVDCFGNSHNLMHLIVVIGVIHMHTASTNDLVWLSSNPTCPA